ncbi:SGNH/GDSL hydrolase family protein [Umezawaea sp.]|uniref:SGNH/GDSL hydrolase family protein n=1 Tax=Umezawaea sp. TaxID=1955258 RepID=UPI002ED33908
MKKLGTVLFACALALASTQAANAGTARTLQVAALGDSYAAGTGAGDYEPGTEGVCYRSANSAAAVVVADLRSRGKQVDFTNVMCSGAAIADLSTTFKEQPPQLDALSKSTDLVFLTVGGNDVGFAEYAGLCIQSDCTGAGAQLVLGQLPAMSAKLTALLVDVKQRSPRARVVLGGYGRAFAPGPNAPDVPLDPICGDGILTLPERAEGATVSQGVDRAVRDGVRAARARGVNAVYASAYTDDGTLRAEFEGHSACQGGTPYYRGLDALAPGQEGPVAVLHPSRAGQAAFAELLARKL